jgi:hypothetical protein
VGVEYWALGCGPRRSLVRRGRPFLTGGLPAGPGDTQGVRRSRHRRRHRAECGAKNSIARSPAGWVGIRPRGGSDVRQRLAGTHPQVPRGVREPTCAAPGAPRLRAPRGAGATPLPVPRECREPRAVAPRPNLCRPAEPPLGRSCRGLHDARLAGRQAGRGARVGDDIHKCVDARLE